MDRLTSMSVFVVAADKGSMAASARRHGLSASMAGKHVAAIETELNVRLMQRTTRSLVLTEAGRAYYARCKRILEVIAICQSSMEQSVWNELPTNGRL
jgi:DNA-binding transcriptional LysR family regulator